MVHQQEHLLNNKNFFMKQIILGVSVFILLLAITSSCKKSTLNPGSTNAAKVSNEWWVTVSDTGTNVLGPAKISTYNTSENDDSIWIDDLDPYFSIHAVEEDTMIQNGFKCKAMFDPKMLTFQSTGSSNYYYPDSADGVLSASVIILNGKVLTDAAKSPTGIPTDSIYFNIMLGLPGLTREVRNIMSFSNNFGKS